MPDDACTGQDSRANGSLGTTRAELQAQLAALRAEARAALALAEYAEKLAVERLTECEARTRMLRDICVRYGAVGGFITTGDLG